MKRKRRVLITGATGMLGGSLVKLWQNKYEVFATSTSGGLPFIANYKQFNLLSKDYTVLIDWAKPDVIIHAAALTNGNECHEDPEKAMDVNGLTSYKLAKAVSSKCRIIYVSSDAVFPSILHKAKEIDAPAPESTYGKSKELGEFYLKQYSSNYTIIRTTIVGMNQRFGKNGFAEWIINSASKKNEIQLFNDVIFNPIACTHLGTAIENTIFTNKFKNQIVHISGSEYVSKYTFGLSLLSKLKVTSESIKKGSILAFNKRAKRSTDQSLDCTFYIEESKNALPNLDECVEQLVKEYHEK